MHIVLNAMPGLFYIHELSFYLETEIIAFFKCIPNQKERQIYM